MSIAADKCNVAWFKLAECISRGEKERALGVYRLLSHSLDDRGVASQLEGDILYAFGDKVMAKNRYDRAIAWYKQDRRLLEMAAVAELMHEICPDDRFYLEMLVDIYLELVVKPKLALCCLRLISLLVVAHDECAAAGVIEQCQNILTDDMVIVVKQHFIFELLKSSAVPREYVMQQAYALVDLLLGLENDVRLQRFLVTLKELNAEAYLPVCGYLENECT